jgi:predicted DsbA family dithiol-disulfide isomerase
MKIDIWTDVVCPWCYLGKRRLELALEKLPELNSVQVVHHSFQLDPTMPQGQSFPQGEILERKYRLSAAQVKEMQAKLEKTAAEAGLEYHLVGGLTGNTLDAHQLLHLAKVKNVQNAVLDRLYKAHFTEQKSIFDRDSLIGLAVEAGLDRDEAREALQTNRFLNEVQADIQKARELGVTGVPFFVIDDKFGISGAQPVEMFERALRQTLNPS